MQEPSFFSDTLSAGREEARLRYRVSAPLGLAAHGLALAAIAVMVSTLGLFASRASAIELNGRSNVPSPPADALGLT